MPDASWPTEFQELSINLTKPALHHFIKGMMADEYALFWRYDAKTIYLMVELGDFIHELPFIRNEHFLTMRARVLYIYDSGLSNALEKLLQTEKGNGIVKRSSDGPQYITSYQRGDIESMIEIDGSEKIMMNKNGSMIQYKDDGKALGPKTLFNMMNMEIDYILMELFESIELKDKAKVSLHKQRLKKLVTRRQQVEQLLKK